MVEIVVDNYLKDIDYICQYCFFPKEYCEYSHNMLIKKKIAAKDKLEEKQEEERKEEEQKENKIKEEKENKEENKENTEKTEKEDDNKEEKKDKKKKNSEIKVLIEESKRGKRKHTTYISNLEKFNINLKDISKVLSKKFACSANVSKEDNGQEIITLTGEFAYEIKEFLEEKYNIKEKDIKVSISNK